MPPPASLSLSSSSPYVSSVGVTPPPLPTSTPSHTNGRQRPQQQPYSSHQPLTNNHSRNTYPHQRQHQQHGGYHTPAQAHENENENERSASFSSYSTGAAMTTPAQQRQQPPPPPPSSSLPPQSAASAAARAAAAAAGAVLIPVYRGGQPEEEGVAGGSQRVGDVALTAEVTLGSLRASLQSQFQLPAGFRMRKRRIPIHPGQDHLAALEFFRGPGDALVVD